MKVKSKAECQHSPLTRQRSGWDLVYQRDLDKIQKVKNFSFKGSSAMNFKQTNLNLILGVVLTTLVSSPVLGTTIASSNKQVPAVQALKMLESGNVRFASQRRLYPNQDIARRVAVSKGQFPFAVVVACSDSRVSPELIFDQGLGDLFVIRTAGNLVEKIELGSVEYAVEHLNAALVIVVGHENCGAVAGALSGKEFPGDIDYVIDKVKSNLGSDNPGNDFPSIMDAVNTNAKAVVQQIKASPALSGKVKSGELKVVPAYYELKSGKIRLLAE